MAGALLEREGAIAEIDRVLADAGSSRGRALFLVGEAGLGKTSLLALARTKTHGFRQGLGRGTAAEVSLPFGILSQAMASLGDVELSRITARRPLDSRATAFQSTLKALRSGGPVLLALDDLQWADPDSLTLLTFLCRRIADQPVVIVGTLRANPPSAIETIRRVAIEGDAVIENLGPLSALASAELLEIETGRPLDPQTARHAWEASGGNPLLLKHLATSLLAEGKLRVMRPEKDSPAGLALLLPRFAGVSSPAYEFARMASVLGTSFRPSDATGLAHFSEKSAALALEELARAGLVRSESKRSAEFVHPLFRQLLYEEIPEPARNQYHAMAFRMLAASGAALSEAAAHARLAGLSGDPQAVAALEGAGRLAMSAGAFSQAREHYQAAVDAAGDQASASLWLALGQAALVGGDVEAALLAYRRVLTLPALPPEVNVTARRLLGRALMVAGRHDQAEAELSIAEEIALRIDRSLAIEVQLDHAGGRWQTTGADHMRELLASARELARDASPQLRRRVDLAWSFAVLHQGDPAGLAVVEAAARAAESDPVSDLGDMAWSWGALGMWMLVARFTERFAESTRAFEISYAAAGEAGMPTAEASLAISQADQLVRLGALREAGDLITHAAELAELVPLTAPWLAVARAHLDFELGKTETSVAACDQAERLGAAYRGRLPVFWLWLWHTRGRLLLDAGMPADAATVYEKVEQLARLSQLLEPCIVPWIWSAIEAHVAAGRIADARRLLETLDRIVAPLPCKWPRAALAIGRARLAERDGDLDQSNASFCEALEHLRRVPMPLAQVEGLIAYGRFLRVHRHPREARPYFAKALELAERSEADRLTRLARDELRAAGGRHRHERRGLLTPQETRVAQLVAEGWSDRQISQRLSISARTVDAHLQHIYSKLGIRSRRDLMRHPVGSQEGPAPELISRTEPAATR